MSKITPPPLKQLLKACIKGDRKAQNELYQRHKVKLFGLCMRYAKSRQEAEDFLQEGFFKIFINLNKYEGKGSFEGWMRSVMVNTALTLIRKKNHQLFPETGLDHLQDRLASSEDIFERFGANAIIEIIQQLPPGYRAVFNLYAIEGFSHKEIAEKLGSSEVTSRTQYLRARKLLQTLLEKQMIN